MAAHNGQSSRVEIDLLDAGDVAEKLLLLLLAP